MKKYKAYYAPYILIGLHCVVFKWGWFNKILYRELDGKCHVVYAICKEIPYNVCLK